MSASIPVTWFPSSVDITHVSLEEQRSPFCKYMTFCKTSTLITAVPSHDMNQGSIRTILLRIKMITPTYKIYFNATFKVTKTSPNIPVTVAPLATHLPASYTTWRDITVFWGAFHTFLSGAKQTQSTSPTAFI